jgi:L-ascorbate metabolism protein UlaG (beta-lactamase superfamily)
MSETTDLPTRPRVQFVGHATVLVEVAGSRIITDPLLTDRVAFIRRVVDPVSPTVWEGLDLVLISHLHHDHLHVPSLRRISRDTPVFAPRGAAKILRRGRFDDIVEVVPGDRIQLGAVSVTVVPAVHDDRRVPLGRRAEPVGYVIEHAGWSCYFAGDTDLFDEMAGLGETIGVALLPVWGWGPTLGHGHLDPVRAADAVELLAPQTVVPIHWGTLWPIGVSRSRSDRLVAPPAELVAALGERAAMTDIRVLQPGDSLRP